MASTAALPAVVAKSSLCWIHSLDALLRRPPSPATGPLSKATASSRRPSSASDMTCLAPAIHSRLIPVVGQQPATLFIRRSSCPHIGSAAVSPRLVGFKGRRGLGVFHLVGRQQITAYIHPQLREAPRDIAQSGESRSEFPLQTGCASQPRQLEASEDAEPQQRHQRHGEQDDQTFGDRHNLPSMIRTAEVCPPDLRRHFPPKRTDSIPARLKASRRVRSNCWRVSIVFSRSCFIASEL